MYNVVTDVWFVLLWAKSSLILGEIVSLTSRDSIFSCVARCETDNAASSPAQTLEKQAELNILGTFKIASGRLRDNFQPVRSKILSNCYFFGFAMLCCENLIGPALSQCLLRAIDFTDILLKDIYTEVTWW